MRPARNWYSRAVRPSERQQLEATISGLEAQRALLGDSLVDKALGPLRAKLAGLDTHDTVRPPAQTLKQVTILFADVVGATAGSQHLDPEDIFAVMDGALARFRAMIEAHQRRALGLVGDGVLAAF